MIRFARQYDPVTRDVRFDDARGSWRAGSPAVELVTATLGTPLGTAARDPSWGIDTSKLDNARPNAEALYRAAATAALSRYVQTGALRDLVVTAKRDVTPLGDAAMVVRVQCRGRDGEPVDTTITYPRDDR